MKTMAQGGRKIGWRGEGRFSRPSKTGISCRRNSVLFALTAEEVLQYSYLGELNWLGLEYIILISDPAIFSKSIINETEAHVGRPTSA